VSRNDGSKLEQLVAQIEGHFLPAGFEVASRTPVFNAEGVQIAEFDIVITGQIGTGRVSWLIECRDRPAGGPAPGEWIEQLVGRRTRFGFDKVMAVSSTGFSPSAVEAARAARIDLRVKSLSSEDVLSWLPLNAPLFIRDGRYSAVRIFAGLKPDSSEASHKPLGIIATDVKVLWRHTETDGDTLSIQELWQRLANKDELWKDVKEGGAPIGVTINALEVLQEGYTLVGESGNLPVESIEFDATLQVVIPRMPLAEATEYSSAVSRPNSKEAFARVGTWKGPEDGIIKELTFIGFLKKDREAGRS